MNKIWDSIDEAVADIRSGSTILVGGFGGAGVPYQLLDALLRTDVRDLTCVSNHAGDFEVGLAALIAQGRVRKMIASFPAHRNSYHFVNRFKRGEIEVEIVPQGLLAERMRAAGAGIAAFYTRVGVGTDVAQGKEEREFNGEKYIMQYALPGDVALIKAHKADPWGNLTYRQAARNFNPVMATAAKLTIVEVDEIVDLGELDPEEIVTPGIYVDRVVLAPSENRVPPQVVQPEEPDEVPAEGGGLSRHQIAARIARELWDGAYVNLGVGVPTLVGGYVPPGIQVIFQSENGILGIGPFAREDEVNPNLVNASRQAVTLLPGGAFFDHAQSFAMIRGGHVDVSILGAYQVSAGGDLANWRLPGETLGNIGGAMDLAVGADQVWVAMTHRDKNGNSKIVEECTYPLTGIRCVTKIFTDLAVIDVTPDGLVLREFAPGLSVADVQAATAAPLLVAPDVKPIQL